MNPKTLLVTTSIIAVECVALASACTCRPTATKAQGPSDSGAASGSASVAVPASASSSAEPLLGTPDDRAPKSWTLVWTQRPLLETLTQPWDLYASTVLQNTLFEEGPLYLERKDSSVRGILDRTVVSGEVDAAGTTIVRDAGTHKVVLRANVQGTQNVAGTLLAEGERRDVRSVQNPPPGLPEGVWRFEVVRSNFDTNASATLTRRGEQITGRITGYGWAKKRSVDEGIRGNLKGDQLQLTIGRETLSLHVGPGLFVGRTAPGGNVVIFFNPQSAAPNSDKPEPGKPLAVGMGLSVVPHFYTHKTRTCEVSLVIPELRGPAIPPEVNQKLSDEIVDRAMGPGEIGRAAVKPEDLRCDKDMGSPDNPWMMDGTYEAIDLGRGWLALRLDGYARGSGARANVSFGCVVVDMNRGEILWPAKVMDGESMALLTDWTERMLRREARQADLRDPEDNMFYANGAPITQDTPLCFTRDGLSVSFNPGTVAKYLPTVGPSVRVPRRLLARIFPKGSRLADVPGN